MELTDGTVLETSEFRFKSGSTVHRYIPVVDRAERPALFLRLSEKQSLRDAGGAIRGLLEVNDLEGEVRSQLETAHAIAETHYVLGVGRTPSPEFGGGMAAVQSRFSSATVRPGAKAGRGSVQFAGTATKTRRPGPAISPRCSRAQTLDAKLEDLNRLLRDREAALDQKDELLSHDRDIRELMGARDLYVAEVYDVARSGETQKPYGRVFYTKGKSLIFYAYDLDRQAEIQRASTFQAWGRRGPERRTSD